ncbi:hypothetical protein JH06_5059 [Blastocystis sp. subtype 4]|uniref:hypothetical protein n=1 Tax=Blastocystis sp. subtype 4 TaxID=944170 RepID=UPI000711A9F2|nr:hypothetical protein JH06_5059 [Blastocystis sp. subtype 4]KNB41670.1 hypothetical protein JH06_5059 [Blastocystis sp. subtype 4]|eukprot:XP_014525113.1 hypothetical protein JH06_5059 [Blastocystis sp. subtype 4]
MTKAPKSIIYTTIARQGTVLVEEVNRSPQFVHSGNFMQVTHILLPKLPTEGTVSHRAVPLRTVFSYLNAVSEEFIAIYGENIYSQQPFCFTAFASSLNVLMNRYNNSSPDRAGKVMVQMDEIKDVMTSNIDKILQRGERLELVIDRTADLAETATVQDGDTTNK